MFSSSETSFKPPPVVECTLQENCLGFGKKLHVLDKICADCLKRHDPQQLREWVAHNASALSLIEEESSRKQQVKRNIEARGRYLCAFEDPDYEHCRWRRPDLNLRGTRADCGVVQRKGSACEKCWRHYLHKIDIVQYFTPLGRCHEEADKVAPEAQEVEAIDEEEDEELEHRDTSFLS